MLGSVVAQPAAVPLPAALAGWGGSQSACACRACVAVLCSTSTRFPDPHLSSSPPLCLPRPAPPCLRAPCTSSSPRPCPACMQPYHMRLHCACVQPLLLMRLSCLPLRAFPFTECAHRPDLVPYTCCCLPPLARLSCFVRCLPTASVFLSQALQRRAPSRRCSLTCSCPIRSGAPLGSPPSLWCVWPPHSLSCKTSPPPPNPPQ